MIVPDVKTSEESHAEFSNLPGAWTLAHAVKNCLCQTSHLVRFGTGNPPEWTG